VTIDVRPPCAQGPQRALLEALAVLRGQGFRICADGVGDGDVPPRLLADLAPDLLKLLDASLLARPAVVRSMRTLYDERRALLSDEGVESEGQCAVARTAGAQLAQGELFTPVARLPAAVVHVPETVPNSCG
jgi:EAL domain-containing protein (putative c-di-GMP-specific phosphodiesterase class I)